MKKNGGLLIRFTATDAVYAVSSKTLSAMAHATGLSKAKLIHLALAKLRDELIPGYPPDYGPVSEKMLRHIRDTVNQTGYKPTRSLFPGL